MSDISVHCESVMMGVSMFVVKAGIWYTAARQTAVLQLIGHSPHIIHCQLHVLTDKSQIA